VCTKYHLAVKQEYDDDDKWIWCNPHPVQVKNQLVLTIGMKSFGLWMRKQSLVYLHMRKSRRRRMPRKERIITRSLTSSNRINKIYN
jgi:hypothetical protein